MREAMQFNDKFLTSLRNCMRGQSVFIIGNGPSVNDHDLSLLDERFKLGINRAYQAADCQVLLWQDAAIWSEAKDDVRLQHVIKLNRVRLNPKSLLFKYKLRTQTAGDWAVPKFPTALHGGGASGPLAYQVARTMDPVRIVLLGFDCCYRGNMTDFYGKNDDHTKNTLVNCQKGLKWIKSVDDGRVINCSANSIWPQQSLEDVLRELGEGMGEAEIYRRLGIDAQTLPDRFGIKKAPALQTGA